MIEKMDVVCKLSQMGDIREISICDGLYINLKIFPWGDWLVDWTNMEKGRKSWSGSVEVGV